MSDTFEVLSSLKTSNNFARDSIRADENFGSSFKKEMETPLDNFVAL